MSLISVSRLELIGVLAACRLSLLVPVRTMHGHSGLHGLSELASLI